VPPGCRSCGRPGILGDAPSRPTSRIPATGRDRLRFGRRGRPAEVERREGSATARGNTEPSRRGPRPLRAPLACESRARLALVSRLGSAGLAARPRRRAGSGSKRPRSPARPAAWRPAERPRRSRANARGSASRAVGVGFRPLAPCVRRRRQQPAVARRQVRLGDVGEPRPDPERTENPSQHVHLGLFGPAREGDSGLRTSTQIRGRSAPRSWGPHGDQSTHSSTARSPGGPGGGAWPPGHARRSNGGDPGAGLLAILSSFRAQKVAWSDQEFGSATCVEIAVDVL
jgi:hypothetical protein